MLKRNMFIPVIWILLPVLWSLPTFAQDTVWSRTYGYSSYDRGYSVQQTTDGGYIMVGTGAPQLSGDRFVWPDIYLLKTNSVGDTLWIRIYGGEVGQAAEMGYSVQQTTDGGYILVGLTASYGAGNSDVYLIKTNSLGDTLWSRTYGDSGDDRGYSVQQTTDRGYIVAGYTESFGAGARDVYLIKTDSLGDPLWSRAYGGSNHDYGYSVQQTTDGGYIVGGYTESFGIDSADVYLIKLSSTGGIQWSCTYGDSGDDQGYSVQQTTDGGYVVAGYTNSFHASRYDVYVIKTHANGGTYWTRTYGESNNDYSYSVQQTTDGGYILSGWSNSFDPGDTNVYVIKTDSLGDTLWSRTYGRTTYDDERGFSVQQTTDGGYIVGGYAESLPGRYGTEFMLTKLDPLGNACIGKFVSSSVMSVSSTVTSPATVITSCSTIVTSPSGKVVSPEEEVTTICVVVRGDANGDGAVDPADVVYLINYLFRSDPAPDPLWMGDANCDGVVDPADIVYLINYLFRDGPAPSC